MPTTNSARPPSRKIASLIGFISEWTGLKMMGGPYRFESACGAASVYFAYSARLAGLSAETKQFARQLDCKREAEGGCQH
jgi:hypothetical protein